MKIKTKQKKENKKMAVNWTVKQVVTDMLLKNESGAEDYGKRFPLATMAIVKLIAGSRDKESVLNFANGLDDGFTMNKMNTRLKAGVPEAAEVGEEPEVKTAPKAKQAPAKKQPAKPAAKATGGKLTCASFDTNKTYTEDELMTATGRELYNITVKKLGQKSKDMADKGKQFWVETILAIQDGEVLTSSADEPEEPANDYESMKIRALYDLCVERKIKIAPKLERAKYIKALEDFDKMEAKKKAAEKSAEKKNAKEDPRPLYQECVKAGIKVPRGKDAQFYKDELAKAQEPEEDSWEDDADDDEGWDF